ncbi:MAG: hypothetical protein CMJ64_20585 [Planctomycetaceae bacterium]|nr:hypothetical protein [Planctomycetaceae bacterium]
MLLRFFLVDADEQFRLVPRGPVEDVWAGRRTTRIFDWPTDDEFRVVSVLCDEETLAPKMCFFLRTELKDNEITDESRFQAYEAMTRHNQRRYDTEAANFQLSEWPRDWQSQLAVALDVPVMELKRIGVGGPLLMADLWGFSIDRILDYFEEACEE